MPPKQKQKQKQPKQKKQDVQQIVKAAVTAAMKSVPGVNPTKNTFLGDMGQFAGNGISKIFGLGAYKMSRNSLYSAQTGNQVPFMHSTSESIIFRHREYIGDVNSSVGFTTSVYQINPGVSNTFPFLSTIASCFQEYRFKGLVFQFKSTGADSLVNGTNTALGTVGLVAQYRSDATTLTTKQEFLNEMWSTSCKTSESCILPIECAPKENPMAVQYVRTGPPTGDIKLYDLCSLTVAANGSPGVNNVGELWASYEVEFFKPTLTPSGGILSSDHWRNTTTGSSALGSTFGVPSPYTVGTVIANNILAFPRNIAGRFLVTLTYVGTIVSFAQGTITPNNCTLVPCWNGGISSFIVSPPGGTMTTVASIYMVVNIDSSNPLAASITFSAGVFPPGNVDLVITEVVDSYN